MIAYLSFLNIAVFVLLALVHFYWAVGGRMGYHSVIPTDSNGRKLFKPGIVVTLVTASLLLVAAWLNLAAFQKLESFISHKNIRYGILLIALLLLIRAIGDMRYLGFTKRFRRTSFARIDTIIFSPLCLLLSISHTLIFFALQEVTV